MLMLFVCGYFTTKETVLVMLSACYRVKGNMIDDVVLCLIIKTRET